MKHLTIQFHFDWKYFWFIILFFFLFIDLAEYSDIDFWNKNFLTFNTSAKNPSNQTCGECFEIVLMSRFPKLSLKVKFDQDFINKINKHNQTTTRWLPFAVIMKFIWLKKFLLDGVGWVGVAWLVGKLIKISWSLYILSLK